MHAERQAGPSLPEVGHAISDQSLGQKSRSTRHKSEGAGSR
jgi:hypothetical protein